VRREVFEKKEKRYIKEELEALRKARESVNNSKKSLDEIAKVYERMQIDMIKAIKDNQVRLTLHAKAMLEVEDRLKTLEGKKVKDDVMFK